MKKRDLIDRLARRSRQSTAAAADQVDRVVHDILEGLKKGEQVSLPGLGRFTPGPKPDFKFEPPPKGDPSRKT